MSILTLAVGRLWPRRLPPALLLLGVVIVTRAMAVESVIVVASSTTSRSTSADYVCDGVADDVQIQQAINALPATGGTVYLTDGTFNLSAMIDLGNKIHTKLTGSGPGTILKIANGTNVTAIRGLQVFDVTFADFAIDGNNANNTTGNGFQFLDSGGAGLKLERLYVYNVAEAAVTVSADEVSILNCEIHDCGKGILINDDAEKCFVIGSRIHQIGKGAGQSASGISCQGARCHFEANVVWDLSDSGITLSSGDNFGHNVAIGNEVYLAANSGINSGGADHVVITGNTCYANGRNTSTPRSNAGIFLRDNAAGTHTSSDAIIMGNRCFEDTTNFPLPGGAVGQLYGLHVYHGTGNSPLNSIAISNDFRSNTTSGIFRENIGAGNVFQKNLGDVTFNLGTATLTSAATTVTVTHGLNSVPSSKCISVTPASDLASATKFWVSNVTSTTFDIKVNAAPGATLTFAWKARVYTEP